MNCSICTSGGEVKNIPYACGHSIDLCSKCSSNIDTSINCAACDHAVFAEVEKELDDIDIKEQLAKAERAKEEPKKSSEKTSKPEPRNGSFPTRTSSAMTRWEQEARACGTSRCKGCGFFFCDCETREL